MARILIFQLSQTPWYGAHRFGCAEIRQYLAYKEEDDHACVDHWCRRARHNLHHIFLAPGTTSRYSLAANISTLSVSMALQSPVSMNLSRDCNRYRRRPPASCDVLINAVKTYDNEAALNALQNVQVSSAFSVQNGVQKNIALSDTFGLARRWAP